MTNSAPRYAAVPPDVDFAEQELEVLRFWDDARVFERSVDEARERTPYSFYDGPPFATGLPHYGHLLASVIKDIVPRYWTMRGHYVPRRFGWDCHGLPVEYEINKKLKVESRKQVLAMGVGAYNAECRAIVNRYAHEWKSTIRRVGRWVDMENAYFTMDPAFMQSVWWAFKQLWDKGLIYEGHKVVPYSVGVSTPLSNFEANQNYKDVQDPALTVVFQSRQDANTCFLAWTTTPWTLPSNLALAVHPDIQYARVRDAASGRVYVLAESLIGSYFPDENAREVLGTTPGASLLGATYVPLFPYFADRAEQGAFRVIASDHVTTDAGTGIVHMAPAYGEEDYEACRRAGIDLVNPVDDDGMFTAEVPDWAGVRVKEADPAIIERLKREGKILKHETIVHSYPFCWRSDTPLIYRAVSTWFVKVEAFKDRLIQMNQATRWVPPHLRDGRFGNWLENARDWAISRNRFWGTPLPIWRNDQGEVVCVGSVDELRTLTGAAVEDIHLDQVQDLAIPSRTGGDPLRHVGTVLDCWFESGSMPFAQWGYPFANRDIFERTFPADFIAEGLDQTRGWFYTLMVMSGGLFQREPFKNVVVNGLILAEDGKKMSKSLRNYPDPTELLDQYGADALRLYLIDSPALKAQELRFSQKGVRDIVRRILLRWWNAYSFFVSYANIDGFEPRGDFRGSPNILDRWIVSRLHSLIHQTNAEMAEYRLYNVVPALLDFIEELTNTFIRVNRPHFWQDGMPEDKRYAFETLHHVLVTLSKLMAPFTPFLSDVIYGNLASARASGGSVHLEPYPLADESLRDETLERAVARMSRLLVIGRNVRERLGLKTKIPLRSLRLIHRDRAVLDALRPLERYFTEELNVKEVVYDADEDTYVRLTAKANFPRLGPRVGKRMGALSKAIAGMTVEQILALERGEPLEMAGESITLEDVEIRRAPRREASTLVADQMISIELDPTVTEDQVLEGLSREVTRRVNMARKEARFRLEDRINLQLACDGDLRRAVERHQAAIAAGTLAANLTFVTSPDGEHTAHVDVEDLRLGIGVSRVAPGERR